MKNVWKKGSFRKQVVVGMMSVAAVSLVAGSAYADYTSEAKTVTAKVKFQRSLSEEILQNVDFGVLELDPVGDEITMNASTLAKDTGTDAPKVDKDDLATTLTGATSGLSITAATTVPALTVKNNSMYTSDTDVTPGVVAVTLPKGVTMNVTPQFPEETVTLTGGAGSVTITDLVKNSSGKTEMTGGDGAAAGNLYIGGKLVYDADVEPTTYTGEIKVSVLYQ